MRKAAPTAVAICATTAIVRAGRRADERSASRLSRPPVGMRARRRCTQVRPNGAPSRSRNASARSSFVTRRAARAATSRAPSIIPTALPASTVQLTAMSGREPHELLQHHASDQVADHHTERQTDDQRDGGDR